jgi:hypothetical protein
MTSLQATENDIVIKDFNVSEKGHGSYWLLGILRSKRPEFGSLRVA